MSITLRPATPDDAEPLGAILFAAFCSIADRHAFPRDFPNADTGAGMIRAFATTPGIVGVVATDDADDGRVVGCNFLHCQDETAAVGPIAVDPAAQGRGIGRRLMEAVLAVGASATGIRLVQDAFNTTSMSLYASLGFDAKEPLALLSGTPEPSSTSPRADTEVRPMREPDLPACAALCRRVHGIERTNELRGAIAHFRPLVVVRDGRVRAYASAPTFWLMNHAVAETDADLHDLLTGAAAAGTGETPLSFLLPIRQAKLLRWCLARAMKLVKPMTLMAMGTYQEPRGTFFPSVLY